MKQINNSFYPVIGLEVHIELSTESKMFCACSAKHFGVRPNTQVCPICLGLPGALPFANSDALNKTIKFGLAFNSEIAKFSKFDRKHYFYPDLPKGYQISQYDLPLCSNGYWTKPDDKKIRVRRIHIEEDTGKLIHQEIDGVKVSLIDFNRSGVPLLELVTEPDFGNTQEIITFLKEVQLIARYLEISDADMEKGSMRLEANISLTKTASQIPDYNSIQENSRLKSGDELNADISSSFRGNHGLSVRGGRHKQSLKDLPPYKVELKNINSFRFLEKAIKFELDRQQQLLEKGLPVKQETRGYNESKGETFSQRNKEEANDYRYFPEPDIPPLTFDETFIDLIKKSLPELPSQKRRRLKQNFNLPDQYIEVLTSDIGRACYFDEATIQANKHNISIKQVADLMVNQNWDKRYEEPALLIKKLLEVEKKDVISTDDLKKKILKVLEEEMKAVADYKKGKVNVLGYLLGKIQQKLPGHGDFTQIKEVLIKLLN